MCDAKRRILLLLDNATSHGCPGVEKTVHGLRALELSNVTCLFLPANTTSVVQPLDAGIIAAFKARYRRLLLEYLVMHDVQANDIDVKMVITTEQIHALA